MKISSKNIRATALQNFWSDQYVDSIYLWYGAQNNKTLAEIEKCDIVKLSDEYSTQEKIEAGHIFCKNFYYLILDEISVRLNRVHNLDLPISFWQTTFGYWLYRHISVTYEKYTVLDRIDIDKTSIKLLSKNDFYIPENHYDYLNCFASDFGVQQLVSHYYYLFKKKQFEVVSLKYNFKPINNILSLSRVKNKYNSFKDEPYIALLGVNYSEINQAYLDNQSLGRIGKIDLPNNTKDIQDKNLSMRFRVFDCSVEVNFYSYFMQTLKYCFPKDLLENFKPYYNACQKEIQSKNYKYVVSENWITSIKHSIYIATAKINNKIFICQEHGGCRLYYKNGMQFIDYNVADIFLSTGTVIDRTDFTGKEFISGGFVCRDIIPYQFNLNNSSILFITTTKFIYWQETNEYGATNSVFIKEMKLVSDFIKHLTLDLRKKLLFRERGIDSLWDVVNLLELTKNEVRLSKGGFCKEILESKIVVIDHMSSGFAEILLMNAPFLLLCDIDFFPLSKELKDTFRDLMKRGVVHKNPQSAALHLNSIISNVEDWWSSPDLQKTLSNLSALTVGEPSKTNDFLLSLLDISNKFKPSLRHLYLVRFEHFIRALFKVLLFQFNFFHKRNSQCK
jgi:putative transferase (TIGR04331 family)